jgi:hypothetical protein
MQKANNSTRNKEQGRRMKDKGERMKEKIRDKPSFFPLPFSSFILPPSSLLFINITRKICYTKNCGARHHLLIGGANRIRRE